MAAFLVFFFISVLSWAQDVCNEWAIHISETQLGTAPQGPPDQNCSDDCFRVYYRVYLEKVGEQQSNSDQQFVFTHFNLTGKLSVSSNTQVSTAGLSEVNLKRSVSCTTTDVNNPLLIGLNDVQSPFTPLLSYNPQTNLIAYEVSSANYGNSSQIGWTVQGTTLLFVLAVDVFPNETVYFDSNDFNFNVTFADGTTCNNLQVEIGTPSDPVAAKTIIQPNNKCGNNVVGGPVLTFGQANIGSDPAFPNQRMIPVFMKGSFGNPNPITFDEIDFLVKIIPDANMYAPKLQSGVVDISSIQLNQVGNEYRAYLHDKRVPPFSIPQSDEDTPENTLFYIVFDGPTLESNCVTSTLEFADYGRLGGGSFSCCKPRLGGPQTYSISAPNCVTSQCPDIKLTVRPESVASQGCSGTAVIGLYADAMNSNDALTDVKAVLEIQHTGGVTFASSFFGVCNAPNSTASCSITPLVTSPKTIRIEIELDAINVSIGPSFGPRLLGNITFSGLESCIEGVVFRDGVVEHTSGNAPCFATLQTNIAPGVGNAVDDLCFSEGIISAVDRNGLKINNFTYYANYHPANTTNCPKTDAIDEPPASFCTCNMKETAQDMLLYSNLDPLNGVNSWDLILISRHNLGLGPLTGFFQLAADVNMSGTTTPFDVVELRKLILGTYTALPDANSWRFVDKNLQNDIIGGIHDPFEVIGYDLQNQICPDCENVTAISIPNKFTPGEFAHYMLPAGSQDNLVDFIGFKVGDVSGDAVPGNFQSVEDRSLSILATGQTTVHGKKGEIVEVAIAAEEVQQLSSLQMTLGFNPGSVTVEDVGWALPVDEYGAVNAGWNIAAPGELRLLWFDALNGFPAEKEMPLCYIKVKLLRDIAEETPLFTKMDNTMQSVCYSPEGVGKAIVLGVTDRAALKSAPSINSNIPAPLKIYPNPASGLFRIEIWSDMEAEGVLTITDAAGRAVGTRQLKLVIGMNTIGSRQLPPLGTGQYEVRLATGNASCTAKLIKQ